MQSIAAAAAKRRAWVLASVLLLSGAGVVHGQTNLPVTHLPEGRSLISLPRVVLSINGTVMPPVMTAEDLLTAIPNGVAVERFVTVCDGVTRWDGTICTDGCGKNALPLGSGCFFVDPVEGRAFMVQVSSTTALEIVGVDGTSTVILPGPGFDGSASGTERISLPFDTGLSRASDLRNSIIESGGDPVVVARFDNATETFFAYTGVSSANDFTLRPGEGYQIQVNTTVAYAPPLSSPQSDAGPAVFRIHGSRTASNFAWEIRDSGGASCRDLYAPLHGVEPDELAEDFAGSIDSQCYPYVSATVSGDMLMLVLPTTGFQPPISLLVGEAGAVTCVVTEEGCDFNPRIYKVEPPEVASLSEIGFMVFALLLAVGAVVLLTIRMSDSAEVRR